MSRLVDWNAELVGQLETHWHERLRPRLEGLTDEEYLWQPVPGCWTVSRRGESAAPESLGAGDFTWDFGPPADPEPVTTIAWRLAHLTVGLRVADPARFEYAGAAGDALGQLDGALDHWVAQVSGLGEAGLEQPQGAGAPPEYADAPIARLVLYTTAEVLHHGAEICLLRDLYLRLAG